MDVSKAQANAERRRKQALRDAEKAERESELIGALANVEAPFAPASIHLHPLYGSAGSIDFGAKDRFKANDFPPLSLADAMALLDTFPPEPVALVRDGCVSFRPAESITDALIDKADTVDEDLFPVLLEHEPAVQWDAWLKLKWWTRIDGELYTIGAYIKRDEWPCRSNPNAKYTRSGVLVSLNCSNLSQCNGGLWIDQVIRFAAGSQTGANRFVAYWIGIEWSGQTGADPKRTPRAVFEHEILNTEPIPQ